MFNLIMFSTSLFAAFYSSLRAVKTTKNITKIHKAKIPLKEGGILHMAIVPT